MEIDNEIMDKFEIWNKQNYIKYLKDEYKFNITTINKYWDRLRKGYNFIIVDKENRYGISFYSIEFFNKMFV